MKVAIPTMGQGGMDCERSGHFGHCDCFTVVDIQDGEIAAAAEEDFQQTLAKSERIYLKTYGAFPLYKRAFGRLMRVFGPLM